MEFDNNNQEAQVFKADFDRVMLELKQQRDEASEQRKEMKRVLDELVASRAENAQLQLASKQTPERAQVDFHYQHVLKEMMSTKEEAKRERDKLEERLGRLQEFHREDARVQLRQAKEEAKEQAREREEARQRELRQANEEAREREETRQKEFRQANEEAREREETMFSREEARRKEAKEEARALRKEMLEMMRIAQKKEIDHLSEVFLVKREVRSPKDHTKRKYEKKYAPHNNDVEHKNELLQNNQHESNSLDNENSKVGMIGLEIPLEYDDDDVDNDDHDIQQKNNIDNDFDNDEHENNSNDKKHSEQQLLQGQGDKREIILLPSTSIITRDIDNDNAQKCNSNIEYLDNDFDNNEHENNSNDEYNSEQQLLQGQDNEEREIILLPSTSIVTRPTPAPSADEIDAWNPTDIVRIVQEVVDMWKSIGEQIYEKRSNSSAQNLQHVIRVIAENEMAFMPVLKLCPNLPIILAHMMVIHLGFSVRTVSWTSKMTEWTEEVSRSHACLPTLLISA